MSNMIEKSWQVVWIGNDSSCASTHIGSYEAQIEKVYSVYQFGTTLTSSNPELANLNSLTFFSEFKCGSPYIIQSLTNLPPNVPLATPYLIPHANALIFGTDAGLITPNFPLTMMISGLTNAYANGNGEYLLTTYFKNDHPTWLNKTTNWRIERNSDQDEWWIRDEKDEGDPTKLPDLTNPDARCVIGGEEDRSYESQSACETAGGTWTVGNDDPSDGDFKDDECTQACQDPIVDDPDAPPTPTPTLIPSPIPSAPTLTPLTLVTNDTSPTWNWSTDDTSVTNFRYKFNGASDWSEVAVAIVSFSPSDQTDGTYTFEIQSGNSTGWSPSANSTVVIDTLKPSAPIPTTTSPTADQTPVFTWPAISDAVQYEVVFDGGSAIIIAAEANPSFTAPSRNHGTYELKVRARDEAGNWSDEGIAQVDIDLQGPSTSVPNPTENPTRALASDGITHVGVEFAWSSNPDVSEYEVVFDEGGDKEFMGNIQGNTSFMSSPVSESRTYSFKVRGIDSVGNESPWGNTSVVVDRIPPGVPAPVSASITNDITPTWSWAGVTGSPTYYQMEYDGNVQGTLISAASSLSWGINPDQSEGDHTLRVRARDEAGNWSDWGSSTVTVDITSPAAPVILAPTGLSPDSVWEPLWKACQLNDGSAECNVTITYSWILPGTLADFYRETTGPEDTVNWELGIPCVALQYGGISVANFRAEVESAMQEWKEAFETEFTNITLTFQSLGEELANAVNVPSSPDVCYIEGVDNIGHIRVGMHPLTEETLAHAVRPSLGDTFSLDLASGGGDLHFDSSNREWRLDSAGASASEYSIKLVAAHELGHSLGFQHSDVSDFSDALMSPTASTFESMASRFPLGLKDSTGDMIAIKEVYGFPQALQVVSAGSHTWKFSFSDDTVQYKYASGENDASYGAWITEDASVTSNGTSFTAPALGQWTRPTLKVKAIDAAGNESATVTKKLIVHHELPAVSGLSVASICPDEYAHQNGECYTSLGQFWANLSYTLPAGATDAYTGIVVFYRPKSDPGGWWRRYTSSWRGDEGMVSPLTVKYLLGDTTYEFLARTVHEGYDLGHVHEGIGLHQDYHDQPQLRGQIFGPPSNVVEYTTPATPDVTPPVQPVITSITEFESGLGPVGEGLFEGVWKPAKVVNYTPSSSSDASSHSIIVSDDPDATMWDSYPDSESTGSASVGLEKYNTLYYFKVMVVDSNGNVNYSEVATSQTIVENPQPVYSGNIGVSTYGYATNKYNEYPGEKWKLNITIPYATDSQYGNGHNVPDVDAQNRNDYSDIQWTSMIDHLPYRIECKQWSPGATQFGYGYYLSKNSTSDNGFLGRKDANNEAGTVHEFRARAYDTNGKSSEWVYHNYTTPSIGGDFTALPTPTNFSVAATQFYNDGTNWTMTASWVPGFSSVGDLDFFRIKSNEVGTSQYWHWDVHPGEAGAIPSSGVPEGFEFGTSSTATFKPNTTYRFKIQSMDTQNNQSWWTDYIQITTSVGDTTPPNPPTNLTASGHTTTSVLLAWNKSSSPDVDYYKIHYTKNSSLASGSYLNWDNELWFASNGNSSYLVEVGGLAVATTYWFAVTSRDESRNYGGPSNIVTSTPQTAPTAYADLQHWVTGDHITPWYQKKIDNAGSGSIISLAYSSFRDIIRGDFLTLSLGNTYESEMTTDLPSFSPYPSNPTPRVIGSSWISAGIYSNILLVMGNGVGFVCQTYPPCEGSDVVDQLPAKKLASSYTVSFWAKSTHPANGPWPDTDTSHYPFIDFRFNYKAFPYVSTGTNENDSIAVRIMLMSVNLGNERGWFLYHVHGAADQESVSPDMLGGQDPSSYILLTEENNLDDGEWHHIMCTFDGSTNNAQVRADGYWSMTEKPINPLLQTTNPSNSNHIFENGDLVISTRGGCMFMDDFRVYNRVLTQPEAISIGSGSGDFPDEWSNSAVTLLDVDAENISDQPKRNEQEMEELQKQMEDRNAKHEQAVINDSVTDQFTGDISQQSVKADSISPDQPMPTIPSSFDSAINPTFHATWKLEAHDVVSSPSIPKKHDVIEDSKLKEMGDVRSKKENK